MLSGCPARLESAGRGGKRGCFKTYHGRGKGRVRHVTTHPPPVVTRVGSISESPTPKKKNKKVQRCFCEHILIYPSAGKARRHTAHLGLESWRMPYDELRFQGISIFFSLEVATKIHVGAFLRS